jgi:hypothetical protein
MLETGEIYLATTDIARDTYSVCQVLALTKLTKILSKFNELEAEMFDVRDGDEVWNLMIF